MIDKYDTSPGSKCEPAGASDAELVERLRYNASIWQRRADDNHPLVKDQLEAAAAIERLTRLCAAYEGTIKADERELDNDYETIERLRQALAAEREAHEATKQELVQIVEREAEAVATGFALKTRAEAAEAERDFFAAACDELKSIQEAKASSPGP